MVVGGCGSGRTTLLRRLEELLGSESEYHDIERVATTPEAFLASVTQTSRYHEKAPDAPLSTALATRAAFARARDFFAHACTHNGSGVTFLLDEVLEMRTFESFPGLRNAPREFWEALCESANRFVLTTRFVARARRLFHDAPDRFEFVHVPPLSPAEISTALHEFGIGATSDEQLEIGRIIHALTDGRPRYLGHLAKATVAMGAGDPVSSLATQMAPGAQLSMACRFSYELRLHRARGYGALKAILQILSGNCASASKNARVHERLPFVASRRRSAECATETLLLRRPCTPFVGPLARSRSPTKRRRSRPRSTRVRRQQVPLYGTTACLTRPTSFHRGPDHRPRPLLEPRRNRLSRSAWSAPSGPKHSGATQTPLTLRTERS